MSQMINWKFIFFNIFISYGLVMCSDSGQQTYPMYYDTGYGDGDADGDADGDTDADADNDTDTDADNDADTDADNDTDTDADNDTDTDADNDADTDADNDADTDADNDADTDADNDTDTDTDGDTDTDADSDTDTDTDSDTDTDTDSDTGADGDTDTDSNTDTGAETDADSTNSVGCGKTPSLKSGNGLSMTVSGSSRTYNLKVPDDYDNTHPYRLIISYHWLTGTANNVSNGSSMGGEPYYGLWELSEGSTIFVAPQGRNNAWSNSGGSDVEFSRQLISTMEEEFCIDKSRIFCEGFSMGGSMSYAMACAMGDVIRGVAAHSGGPMSGCETPHDNPVAYFMTHGTNDGICRYPQYGVPELNDFAEVNGCTARDMPSPTDSSGAEPACVDFEGCDPDYPTRACIFIGDHTPNPGRGSSWVPEETWKFITQF